MLYKLKNLSKLFLILSDASESRKLKLASLKNLVASFCVIEIDMFVVFCIRK